MEIECINKCGNLTDTPESDMCETCRETSSIKPLNIINKLLDYAMAQDWDKFNSLKAELEQKLEDYAKITKHETSTELYHSNEKLEQKIKELETSVEQLQWSNDDITKRSNRKHDERMDQIKNLKKENERLTMDKAILGSFQDDVKAFFTMNDVDGLETLDYEFNNLKQKLKKIKERYNYLKNFKGIRKEWHERVVEELGKLLGVNE